MCELDGFSLPLMYVLSYMSAAHQLMSCGLSHLPIDIHVDIFCTLADNTTFMEPSPHLTPMLLSQVCHSWRAITLNCSCLWSSMDIIVVSRSDNGDNIDNIIRLARTWIRRSGTHPFSFRLRINSYDGDGRYPPLRRLVPLVDVLLITCTRWNNVEFIMYYSEHDLDDHLDWGDTGAFQFPRLRRLSVSANRHVFQHMNRRLNINHDTTPALRSMHVDGGMDVAPVSRPLDIPFDVMTNLSVGAFTSQEDLFRVMSKCLHVRRLQIHVGVLMLGSPPPCAISVHLPALSSLKVASYSGFQGLTDGWTFPSLDCLCIQRDGGVSEWPQMEFQDFVVRSSCSITQLELIDVGLRPEQLIAVIRSIHASLQCLRIDCTGGKGVASVDDSVLLTLTWDNTRHCNMCPALRKLEFNRCLTFSQGVFARMVMSRSRYGAGVGDVTPLEVVWVMSRKDCPVSQVCDFDIMKYILPKSWAI